MGRDIRKGKTGKDRNFWYKGELNDDSNKLTRADECQGVFYSTDYEPIIITGETIDNVKHTRKTVKLLTNDYIPTMSIDDYVLYNDEYWLVDSITVADLTDNAKPYKRHSNQYILGLKL